MTLFFAGTGFAYGKHENVMISCYRYPPTPEEMRRRIAFLDEEAKRYESLQVFTLVTHDAGGFPSPDHRRESRAQYAVLRERVSFCAIVIEGTSVNKTLLRSFFRTIGSFTTPFEIKFYRTVIEASNVCATKWDAQFGGAGLAETIEELRKSIQ